nr:MAG TPA: toxin [Caudoviricetes sp.]
MTRHSKEMVQYSTASVSLLSGIILTFLSFFLNEHKIPNEVLWYVS